MLSAGGRWCRACTPPHASGRSWAARPASTARRSTRSFMGSPECPLTHRKVTSPRSRTAVDERLPEVAVRHRLLGAVHPAPAQPAPPPAIPKAVHDIGRVAHDGQGTVESPYRLERRLDLHPLVGRPPVPAARLPAVLGGPCPTARAGVARARAVRPDLQRRRPAGSDASTEERSSVVNSAPRRSRTSVRPTPAHGDDLLPRSDGTGAHRTGRRVLGENRHGPSVRTAVSGRGAPAPPVCRAELTLAQPKAPVPRRHRPRPEPDPGSPKAAGTPGDHRTLSGGRCVTSGNPPAVTKPSSTLTASARCSGHRGCSFCR